MNDLISRQAVIDMLATMQGRCTSKTALIQNSKIWQQIKDMPSAQPEQRWIPCNERLPKYGKNVLITNDKGNVSYGKFRGVEFWREDGDAHWQWKHNTIEHVLAWMPLPESWKGEANERMDIDFT